MNKAILVEDYLKGFNGYAALYRLSPAYKSQTQFVVVSTAHAFMTGVETYIFPSDDKGKVTDWGELKGSYRGGSSHAKALQGMGYELKAKSKGVSLYGHQVQAEAVSTQARAGLLENLSGSSRVPGLNPHSQAVAGCWRCTLHSHWSGHSYQQ